MRRGDRPLEPSSLFSTDLPTMDFGTPEKGEEDDEERGLSTFGASLNGLQSLQSDSSTDIEQFDSEMPAEKEGLSIHITPVIEELPRAP